MTMATRMLTQSSGSNIHDDVLWTEAIEVTPGEKNVGEPLPYQKIPKGYKLIGTPDS